MYAERTCSAVLGQTGSDARTPPVSVIPAYLALYWRAQHQRRDGRSRSPLRSPKPGGRKPGAPVDSCNRISLLAAESHLLALTSPNRRRLRAFLFTYYRLQSHSARHHHHRRLQTARQALESEAVIIQEPNARVGRSSDGEEFVSESRLALA
eukprot:scaffold34513_cov37-Prasinocladus_malaysianus.AAC.2